MILFDFADPGVSELFHPIDDVVMGGVSGSVLVHEGGVGVFTGAVSFEHGGGFASVRSKPGRWDLSGYTGLELRHRGDGKTYKLSVTTDPRPGQVVYRARFTAGGDWETERLPFASFEPLFRGVRVPEAPALDPAHVTSYGFLISDRQEGPFRLEVRSLQAY